MRSYRATHNLLAVSANLREKALNTEQTLDTSLLVATSDIISLDPRSETNADEATGKEEPDVVYDLGKTSSLPLTFKKAQPQHFAFLLAYALGDVSLALAGIGYQHIITPIAGDQAANSSQPTFTAAQRYGETVLKRRFASLAIDSVSAVFTKDSWLQVTGQAKGTGKVETNIFEETVSALNNAASLILAVNGVEGITTTEKTDSIQSIKAEISPGVWEEVTVEVVGPTSPATITITPLAGDGLSSINYKVLYIPTESGWMSFPSRVIETPMRISSLTMTMGGTWDGSAFQGGRELTSEISSVEYLLNNNLQVEFTPGASGAYASRIWRDGRTQALKLNREMRDYILQQHMDDNDTFGVRLLARGAEFDEGHNYEVDLVFPKCAVLAAPISVDGKKLAEAGDLVVLEHDTYGSVICKVKNMVNNYAA